MGVKVKAYGLHSGMTREDIEAFFDKVSNGESLEDYATEFEFDDSMVEDIENESMAAALASQDENLSDEEREYFKGYSCMVAGILDGAKPSTK